MKALITLGALLISTGLYAGSYNVTCMGEVTSGQKVIFSRGSFSLVTVYEDAREPAELLNLVTTYDDSPSEGSVFEFAYSFDSEEAEAKVSLDKKIAEVDSWEEGGESCNGGHAPGAYGSTTKFQATLTTRYGAPATFELTCTERGGYSGNCQYDEELE